MPSVQQHPSHGFHFRKRNDNCGTALVECHRHFPGSLRTQGLRNLSFIAYLPRRDRFSYFQMQRRGKARQCLFCRKMQRCLVDLSMTRFLLFLLLARSINLPVFELVQCRQSLERYKIWQYFRTKNVDSYPHSAVCFSRFSLEIEKNI